MFQHGLEDQVYHRIGEMISVSLIHGGPSPAFLAPCVIDYMIHGMKARASVEEVPTKKITALAVCILHFLNKITLSL